MVFFCCIILMQDQIGVQSNYYTFRIAVDLGFDIVTTYDNHVAIK